VRLVDCIVVVIVRGRRHCEDGASLEFSWKLNFATSRLRFIARMRARDCWLNDIHIPPTKLPFDSHFRPRRTTSRLGSTNMLLSQGAAQLQGPWLSYANSLSLASCGRGANPLRSINPPPLVVKHLHCVGTRHQECMGLPRRRTEKEFTSTVWGQDLDLQPVDFGPSLALLQLHCASHITTLLEDSKPPAEKLRSSVQIPV
jgi:hypothetical protein